MFKVSAVMDPLIISVFATQAKNLGLSMSLDSIIEAVKGYIEPYNVYAEYDAINNSLTFCGRDSIRPIRLQLNTILIILHHKNIIN